MAAKPADLLPAGPRTVVGWWVRKGYSVKTRGGVVVDDPLGLEVLCKQHDDKYVTAAYAVEATEAYVIEYARANPDSDGWMDYEFALAACLPGLHDCLPEFDYTQIEEDPGSPDDLDVDGWTVAGSYFVPGDWSKSGRTCVYTWTIDEAPTPWDAYKLTVAHAESHGMKFMNAGVFAGIIQQDPNYPYICTDVTNAEEMAAKFSDDWPMQREPDWNTTYDDTEEEDDGEPVVRTVQRTYSSPIVEDVVVVQPAFNPYGYWYADQFVPVMDPVTALEADLAFGAAELALDMAVGPPVVPVDYDGDGFADGYVDTGCY